MSVESITRCLVLILLVKRQREMGHNCSFKKRVTFSKHENMNTPTFFDRFRFPTKVRSSETVPKFPIVIC